VLKNNNHIDYKLRPQKRMNRISAYSVIIVILSFFQTIQAQDTISKCNFDSGMPAGWTTGASGLQGSSNNRNSWAVGIPKGGRGYNDYPGSRGFIGNPDPLNDHTTGNSKNYVAGEGINKESRNQGVSSHYNLSNEWIKSAAINCSNYIHTRLEFWRWANFETSGDKAILEISTDGNTWIDLGHPLYPQDVSWTYVSFDISRYADHISTLYIRWRSESDTYIHYSGWNVDDVVVLGVYNTNNYNSKILDGPLSEPSTISSCTDSLTERTSVFDFTIQDMGSGDHLPTNIDTLCITAGDKNMVSSFYNAIAGAYLYGPNLGLTTGSELRGKIYADKIVFGAPGMIQVDDNTSETYVIRLYLKKNLSLVRDNDILELQLNYQNVVKNLSGSLIGSGLIESGDNKIRIDIKASSLAFATDPNALQIINTVLTPAAVIKAQDENGNQDLDFTAPVTLSNNSNITMVNNTVNAQTGQAVFSATQFTRTGGPASLKASCSVTDVTSATSVVQITVTSGGLSSFFTDNFDRSSITNWTSGAITGSNSWAYGVPHGGQGYSDNPLTKGFVGNFDPTVDHSADNTTNYVYGQGLAYSSKFEGRSSHYNNSNEWLMSPAINCQNYTGIKLSFWRWANFENQADKAYVEISTDKVNWIDLGQPLYPQDKTWVYVEIDISKYADRQSAIYIRWKSLSGQYTHYSGWNIDDVDLSGILYPLSTWTGKVSNDWNTAGNWSTNAVPDKFTCVTIPASVTQNPVVSTEASCKDIVVSKGQVLTVSASGSLTVYGNLTAETDANVYASVIDYGKLTVNGKLSMNKYITNTGYNFISSPVTSFKANNINNSVYSYNEPEAADDWSKGWKRINTEMEKAIGYDANFGHADTISFSGSMNTGNIEIVLTNTDGAEIPEHEGWNLVGNPYACALDWDAASGWVKDNVENAIYFWDPVAKNYKSYVNGIGTNGGSGYIQPMQAYFVKVKNPGTGRLGMNGNAKTLVTGSRFKKTPGTDGCIRITIGSNGYSDETVIAFNDNSTNGFDASFDAYKKFSGRTEVPQLFSLSEDDDTLSINVLSKQVDYNKIVMGVRADQGASCRLTIEGAMDAVNGKTVYLEDKLTGRYLDLLENNSYEFVNASADAAERFVIHIGMPLNVSYTKTDASCHGSNNGAIDLTVMGGKLPYGYMLWSNGLDEEDLYNLKAGKYQFVVVDAENTIISDTIIISEPEMPELSFQVTDASGADIPDGSVDLSVSVTHTESYKFEWSDNETSEDIYNVTPGLYTVEVTYANGCKVKDSVEVSYAAVSGLEKLSNPQPVEIYSNLKTIFINFNSENINRAHVAIYGMNGGKVLDRNLDSTRNRLETSLNPGQYIVKATNGSTVSSVKVILR
jgi:hypothetical protein